MINKSTTPRKRRTALACAAALVGVTVVVGVGASPVAARPDYGAATSQRPIAPAVATCGVTDPPGLPSVKPPSKTSPYGDVHVDRGLMLR